MRYVPDHEEPSSNHHKEDGTPGGDNHHNRERDKELKRVRDTKEQQKDTPRKRRGK